MIKLSNLKKLIVSSIRLNRFKQIKVSFNRLNTFEFSDLQTNFKNSHIPLYSIYFCRFTNKIRLDAFDGILLGVMAGSSGASIVIKYFSEDSADRRLRNSLIQKSNKFLTKKIHQKKNKKLKIRKLLKSQKFNVPSKKLVYTKVQNLYNFVLKINAGTQEEEFELAQRIQFIIKKLLVFLLRKENRAVRLKIIFTCLRISIETFLKVNHLEITYRIIDVDKISVITFIVGTSSSFVYCWFKVAGYVFLFSGAFSVLLLRSIYQQILSNENFYRVQKLNNKIKQKIKVQKIITDFKKNTKNSSKPFQMED